MSLCSTKCPTESQCSALTITEHVLYLGCWWSNHFYKRTIPMATRTIGLTSVPSINSWKTTMAASKQTQQSSVQYLGQLSHFHVLSRQTGRTCNLLLSLPVNQMRHGRAAVLQHIAFFQGTVIQETSHPARCCVALAEQSEPQNPELSCCLACKGEGQFLSLDIFQFLLIKLLEELKLKYGVFFHLSQHYCWTMGSY